MFKIHLASPANQHALISLLPGVDGEPPIPYPPAYSNSHATLAAQDRWGIFRPPAWSNSPTLHTSPASRGRWGGGISHHSHASNPPAAFPPSARLYSPAALPPWGGEGHPW